jgi:ABC-2 type transport system ATP-binding protein
VQEFLRYYQARQTITVLLTSHYMKDVEALCARAIVINEGQIKHDGPLSDIVDRFSRHKVIELQFAGNEIPPELGRYGKVLEARLPRVKIEVPRARIPEVLSALLSHYAIEDVSVHERPLEEVIAEMFMTETETNTVAAEHSVSSLT